MPADALDAEVPDLESFSSDLLLAIVQFELAPCYAHVDQRSWFALSLDK